LFVVGGCVLSIYANSIETYNGVGGVVTATLLSGSEDNYQIEAVANTAQGYEFLYWADGTTTNPLIVTPSTIKADGYYNAIFAKSIDIRQPNGQVQVNVADVADPKAPVFTLQAVPNVCGIFTGWLETGSASNPLTYVETDGTRTPMFAISSSGSIHAEYEQGNGGMVAIESIPYSCNQYKLTATPNTGYEFLYWLDGNADNPRTITCANKYTEYGATFAKTNDIHRPTGSVQVTVADPAVPSYTLKAISACGSFTKWNNSLTTNPLSYVETDGDVFPLFDTRNVLVQHEDHEGGRVQLTPLTCGFGLKAIANNGYRFQSWNTGQTTDSITIAYAEGDYYASFIPAGYTAQRGSQIYSSVQSAVDVVSNDPVVLLANTDEHVQISSPVTMEGDNRYLSNLSIINDGDLTLTTPLNVENLYLSSSLGTSSQVHNASQLICQQAYYDVQLEPELAVAVPRKWYAFSVPFKVDVQTGVRKSTSPDTQLANQVDYLIWEYDGTLRAANKDNGWVQMAQGTLFPGRFYMMGINSTENIWRFVAKDGVLGGNASLPVSEYPSDYQNRGWNALANSLLVYASASVDGVCYAQVYDNNSVSGKYNVVALAASSFAMACPFFIQSKADDVLLLAENHSGTLYAPTRTTTSEEYLSEVQLLKDGRRLDNLFLTANHDATYSYDIGKDVIKIMGDTTDSYIWANGYGYQLCAQDLPLEDEVAFTLCLFAASEGQYTLSATDGYLYFQEEYIADLSKGDYSLYLTKGKNVGYTIRLRKSELPTATMEVNSTENIGKYIYNNALYIRKNGKVYNAQGVFVR